MITDTDVRQGMGAWILLGLLGGVLLTISPGSVMMFTVCGLGILLVRRNATPEDRPFLVKLMLLALASRIIAAFLLHVVALATGHASGKAAYLPGIGDDVAYSGMGWALVKFWRGGREDFPDVNAVELGSYFLGFNTYLHALVYERFGWVPLVMKYLNCLVGTLTGVFMFWVAKECAGPRIARWVAAIVAFVPSLWYWSISNLKDPMVTLSLVMLMWSLIRWRGTARWRYLAYAGMSLWLLGTYREALLRPTMAAILVGMLWLLPWARVRRALRVSAVVGIVLTLCVAPLRVRVSRLIDHQAWTAMSYQLGSYFYRGQTYRVYPDRVYEAYIESDGHPAQTVLTGQELRSAVVKGITYFFLSPFPWHVNSALELIMLPQILVSYVLILPFFLGAGILIRRRPAEAVPVGILFMVLGLAMALAEANAGAAVRHRDLLTPFFILFAVVGLASSNMARDSA